ncbi:CBS domain-containing protein [Rhodococcus qingshengii]|uniref:CBS domain-containing protein n=1 Tax=Rhodococcus qingshengii TaxID=334542 RepID=UPI001C5E617A|nr:CBS domain-containing protein [Rhodococcus qingshengii]MBW4818840.1 CBS domain-containing protein [Rhodococcus qingshengii]MCZ4618749.1 CBS domain-containing protein [Rhodococcus qingshengii]
MSTSAQSDRFINAFNEIETHMRRRLQVDDGVSFVELVVKSQQARRLSASDVEALRAFAKLRNAIQHSRYYDGKPIAEPVLEIVERIENVRQRIINPPNAYGQFRGQRPIAFRRSAELGDVLKAIREFDYSQFPVYDGDGRYEGMLTTNCIARWLADGLATDGLVESKPISAVIAFAEAHEVGWFVAKTTTVAEAIRRLSPRRDGRLPPVALLVTEAGRTEEKLLAIVVADDLPVLTAALDAT